MHVHVVLEHAKTWRRSKAGPATGRNTEACSGGVKRGFTSRGRRAPAWGATVMTFPPAGS